MAQKRVVRDVTIPRPDLDVEGTGRPGEVLCLDLMPQRPLRMLGFVVEPDEELEGWWIRQLWVGLEKQLMIENDKMAPLSVFAWREGSPVLMVPMVQPGVKVRFELVNRAPETRTIKVKLLGEELVDERDIRTMVKRWTGIPQVSGTLIRWAVKGGGSYDQYPFLRVTGGPSPRPIEAVTGAGCEGLVAVIRPDSDPERIYTIALNEEPPLVTL
jgi:hypothetical protein